MYAVANILLLFAYLDDKNKEALLNCLHPEL